MIKIEFFVTICISYHNLFERFDTSNNIVYIFQNLKCFRYEIYFIFDKFCYKLPYSRKTMSNFINLMGLAKIFFNYLNNGKGFRK